MLNAGLAWTPSGIVPELRLSHSPIRECADDRKLARFLTEDGVVVGLGFRTTVFEMDVILTAAHVMHELRKRDYLVAVGDKAVPLSEFELCVKSSSLDLAAFKPKKAYLFSYLGLRKLNITDSAAGVTIKGYENGVLYRSNGNVEPTQRPFIVQHFATTFEGWSGSPLMSKERVYGLHLGGLVGKDGPVNLALVLYPFVGGYEASGEKRRKYYKSVDVARIPNAKVFEISYVVDNSVKRLSIRAQRFAYAAGMVDDEGNVDWSLARDGPLDDQSILECNADKQIADVEAMAYEDSCNTYYSSQDFRVTPPTSSLRKERLVERQEEPARSESGVSTTTITMEKSGAEASSVTAPTTSTSSQVKRRRRRRPKQPKKLDTAEDTVGQSEELMRKLIVSATKTNEELLRICQLNFPSGIKSRGGSL
jgi:hypothetical protein